MNKYEWIEGVMASKISASAKVFAFGLFKHMNQDGRCFPGDAALVKTTGMSRGHFFRYRRVLKDGGWILMEERKTSNGNSYIYSIPAGKSASNGGILNDESASDGGILDEQSAPIGGILNMENASDGAQSASNGAESASNGGMNTVSNTLKNTTSKDKEEEQESTVADAPVDSSEVREQEKGNKHLLNASQFRELNRLSLIWEISAEDKELVLKKIHAGEFMDTSNFNKRVLAVFRDIGINIGKDEDW